VRAVEPGRCLGRHLLKAGTRLVLRRDDGTDVEHAGPVFLVAAGKAAGAMAARAVAVVGPALSGGLVVVPHGAPGGSLPPGVSTMRAAHPVPDQDGLEATRRLLDAVQHVSDDTLVLVALSGGASALLVAPAGGLELADKRAVTRELLAAGADIAELNAVRKHCSRIKGGGLLRAGAHASAVWTMLLSDVMGDDPTTIASGPTVPDPTTFADALDVLRRYSLVAAVPRVTVHLERGARGEHAETLDAASPLVARSQTVVVGSNGTAVRAAAEHARARGYHVTVEDVPIAGDAATAGRALAARLLRGPAPHAIIAGGEPTVEVVAGGRGGRAQQLALAAAEALAGRPCVMLAAGTDGVDGPTDAAGACVDGGTLAQAQAHGLDVTAALAATDAHPVLDRTDALVRTGPTGTNVADLVVALRGAC